MSLPANWVMPMTTDFEEIEDVNKYVRDLTFQLQIMYQQISQSVNGDIRGSSLAQAANWTPIMKGASTAGTFTYTHQTGWSLRRGLITDVWFDVAWSSAGTAAGNLYLELPYKVCITNNKPFYGAVQGSSINYAATYTEIGINAISNTYRGEIWKNGSNVAAANLAVVGSGEIVGHIRYIGVSDERA